MLVIKSRILLNTLVKFTIAIHLNTRNKNVVLYIDPTFSLKSIYGTEISFVTNRTTKKILAIVSKKILHIIQQTML